MGYNKDIDYQEKINEAVEAGDYVSAANYEQSRNEKIEKENLPYAKTNNYSGWLDKTDYSNVIREQISSGASKSSVADTLKKRIKKASGTAGLTKYAYDDVYDEAIKYIRGNGSFDYEASVPEYRDKYSDDIEKAYRRLLNIDEFEYNPFDDELYEYYKLLYNREGHRAMQDLLGELSANTGGIPSSYAVSAAGQMLDKYNEKLAGKIPELYNSAYERYLKGIDTERDNLSMLAELSDTEYEHYLDELNQYNKNRDFEYKTYGDYLDERFRQKEQEYDREDEAYDREQSAVENALKKWAQLGYLDSESARILGLDEGLSTSDYDYKKAQKYKIYNS